MLSPMKHISSFLLLSAGVMAGITGCAGTARGPVRSTFIDVHEFGPGKVTAADVAKAHEADLAAQGKQRRAVPPILAR